MSRVYLEVAVLISGGDGIGVVIIKRLGTLRSK